MQSLTARSAAPSSRQTLKHSGSQQTHLRGQTLKIKTITNRAVRQECLGIRFLLYYGAWDPDLLFTATCAAWSGSFPGVSGDQVALICSQSLRGFVLVCKWTQRVAAGTVFPLPQGTSDKQGARLRDSLQQSPCHNSQFCLTSESLAGAGALSELIAKPSSHTLAWQRSPDE